MKKLLTLVVLVAAALVVMFVPEARAQVRRGSDFVLGSENTKVRLDGVLKCGYAAACGSVALTSGSPSTATVTVPSGVTCSCSPVGATAAIAAAGCAASVTSTTLTLTGPNTVTTTMRYMCFY
jgi:hypothetical protein